jgi:ABC-type transport system, involved in lipoprotein release, permease component
MVPLATRNLFADTRRFAMSVAGVAFAVLLVLIVLSLYRGWSDVGRLYERLPGELWLSQPATSDPFHSTSFLPLADGARASRVAGVRAAIPVYTRHIAFDVRGRTFDVFTMAVDVAHGAYAIPRGGIDIDRMLAQQAGLGVGDRFDVLGRTLRVVHVHSGGNSIFQTAFLNATDARALFGIDGLTSFFLLDLRPGADPRAVAGRVVRALPGTETHTGAQFARSFADRVNAGFLAVVGVLVGIGFVVGGAVIALTTYTATVEKAQEFGVLKAIGASGRFLYTIVLRQSLVVGGAGAALGIAASVAAANLIKRQVPEFITVLTLRDALAVFALALATAVVASYVPVRRIERIDPAEAFRP